jgi:hypothetical protein
MAAQCREWEFSGCFPLESVAGFGIGGDAFSIY